MAKLRTRIAQMARRREAASHVHFHTGPQGYPSPCFDPRCATPRLDV
jgi:hypothetical protein